MLKFAIKMIKEIYLVPLQACSLQERERERERERVLRFFIILDWCITE
jgi:hypothetical protein